MVMSIQRNSCERRMKKRQRKKRNDEEEVAPRQPGKHTQNQLPH